MLLLMLFGLLAIFDASSVGAFRSGVEMSSYFQKQLQAALLGLGMFFILQHIPISFIKKLTLPLFIFTFILLILIFVPSLVVKAKGADRWLRIAGFLFQPSELAKVSMILFITANLTRPGFSFYYPMKFLIPIFLGLTLFLIPIFFQPDLGTTILILSLCGIMLIIAGLPRRWLIGGVMLGLVSVTAAIIQSPYRLRRITSFLNPWADAHHSGFQIIQSFLAFQNGSLMGLGIGESKQKLFYLPEAHTDFILAMIGEEFGLLGVSLIIILFFYLTHLGWQVMRREKNLYKKNLALGITLLIALEALLNMAVTMGLLPTKGMPLPLMSYGRSSLLCFVFLIGILSRISRENRVAT